MMIAEQLHDGRILHPFGRFFILFILLGFQPFRQVALPVTMEIGSITIFA